MYNIKKKVKNIIFAILRRTYAAFPERTTIISHYLLCKEKINLKNPKTFNEKLEWLKINYKNDNISLCADKYKVRDFVRDKVGSHILNPLIAVYNTVDEINWDILPKKYVIKCTHGAGYNIIITDNRSIDINILKNKLSIWLQEKYGDKFFEPHYNKIFLRIIVEKYIESLDGKYPMDYKIYCFNGKAQIILVVSGRGEKIHYDYFNANWDKLNIGLSSQESKKEIGRPQSLNEMLHVANALSAEFPFVRVDLYEYKGRCLFGELTFTPAGNIDTEYSEYGKYYLGELLDISNIQITGRKND